MKNFVKPGDHIEVDGPTVSGEGKLVGAALFGVAIATVAASEKGALVVEGEVDIAKLAADNLVAGQKVNWDDTAKEVKAAAGDLDAVGTVTVDADNTKTSVRIKLTPT